MSNTLPPPLICRQASLADAWNLTSVFIQSFREDEMSRWIYQYPKGNVPEHTRLLNFATNFRLPDFKRMLVSNGYHAFIVEDRSTGQAVGLSNWNVVPPENKLARREKSPIQYRALGLRDRLKSWLYWAYDQVATRIPLAIYKIFSPEKAFYLERKLRFLKIVKKEFADCILEDDKRDGYWILAHLGVLPEYSGRKIAAALLNWGMVQADKEDRAVYLIATAAGAPVYHSKGFETLSACKYFEGEANGGFEITMMRLKKKSERSEKSEKIAV